MALTRDSAYCRLTNNMSPTAAFFRLYEGRPISGKPDFDKLLEQICSIIFIEIERNDQMTILYEPNESRFRMPTEIGDAMVDFAWEGDVMILQHAEVPSGLRGSGAGGRLANGVFAAIEAMGIKARPTCPFLVRVARSDPRWQELFGV
jgi:uncharacterized protein